MGYINLDESALIRPYLTTPAPYARMHLYHPGGTTLAPIFRDEGLTVMRANPVDADTSGLFPTCYAMNGTYEAVIMDRTGAILAQDPALLVRSQQANHAWSFASVDQMRASTLHGYPTQSRTITVRQGQMFQVAAGGFLYTVADEADTGFHLQTAGGVKLTVQSDGDGFFPVEAFGFTGDGTPEDRACLQAASDATPFLKFQPKTYELGAYVPTPAGYGSHKHCCLLAQSSICWRSLGRTTLRISDAAQSGPDANDIALIFMEDLGTFSAADFVLDENASAQGFGGALACYGVAEVSLNKLMAKNCNPLRLGASANRLCGRVSGSVEIQNAVGTFAVGGKPGGAEVWHDVHAMVTQGGGGINIECEDADGRGLAHVTREATLGQVTGFDLDGGASPVEFVKIEDGLKNATVGAITLRDAQSAATGRAAALSVKTGQIGVGPDQVSVGQIVAQNCEQAVYAESGASPIGMVKVNSVQADQVRSILACTHGGPGSLGIRSIMITSAQGTLRSPSSPNSGTAFDVNLKDEEQGLAPHLDFLGIGGGHLRSVHRGAFSIRGVKHLSCGGLTVDAHTVAAPSGGYAGTLYNVIEADDIVLTNTVLRGFGGGSVPLELRPKRSCRLVGLEIEAGPGAGSALFLNGSGAVSLEGCRFSGGTAALNFRVMEASFDAGAAVDPSGDTITLPGHVFFHGEQVRYTEGTTPIGGLTDGADYFVRWVDGATIQLSQTRRGAPLDLTSAGSGTANLRKALHVRAHNTRNECTSLTENAFRALSFTQLATW